MLYAIALGRSSIAGVKMIPLHSLSLLSPQKPNHTPERTYQGRFWYIGSQSVKILALPSETALCVCLSVRLCALSRSHFLIDFHQNWHRRKKTKLNRFRWGQNRTTLPLFLGKKAYRGKWYQFDRGYTTADNKCMTTVYCIARRAFAELDGDLSIACIAKSAARGVSADRQ